MMAMRSGFRGLVRRNRRPGEKPPSRRDKFTTILLVMFGAAALLYLFVSR